MKKVLIAVISLLFIVACAKKDVTKGERKSTRLVKYEGSGSDRGQAGDMRSVHFAFDKSSLSEKAKESLRANAEWLKENGETSIQVEGHCDSRGTIEYNLALGTRRATRVREYLTMLGVDRRKINTISYGEEKPLALGGNEWAWAQNRRANFVIVSQ